MKYVILVLLGLLLEACADRDRELRHQIAGNWSRYDSAQLTLAPNGCLRSSLKFADMDVNNEGSWRIRDGVLITKITHSSVHYKPGVTNLTSVSGDLNPLHNRVFLIDSTHLAVVSDPLLDQYGGPKTNVWERKL
jgi:hypothetical protein